MSVGGSSVAGGSVAGSSVASSSVTSAAAATPVLSLEFAQLKYLKNSITFTRSTKGWAFGSDGVLDEYASGKPRFDHVPSSGKSLGLLVEEQRTNSLLDNRDLSTGNWTIVSLRWGL